MFYALTVDDALRFGDVVDGYISTVPTIVKPTLTIIDAQGYKIDVRMPRYSVILSPCCSIREETISLTPLIPAAPNFFKNPYFAEDLTIINRPMEPQQTLSPDGWEKLPPEEKQTRLAEGFNYALLHFFVYEQHDLFPYYELRDGTKNNYYMIDFRSTYRLNCGLILSPTNAPLQSKCLQLSIETRSELRDKLAYYYSRVPEEDQLLQD